MHIASLATFCLYRSPLSIGKTAVAIVHGDTADEREHADTLERMIAPWKRFSFVRKLSLREFEWLESYSNDEVFVLMMADAAGYHAPRHAITIVPTVPEAGTEEFGFMQEMESHDFELGGVNEWREDIPCNFSRFVLQTLSREHIKRSFPFHAWAAVKRIIGETDTGKLQCLDIGCGPISRLRWGALQGWLEIFGIDPLNDLYDSIMARHGYEHLPMLRPQENIAGYAESADLKGRTFDIVFSMNALDHTQDLPCAIATILRAMRPGGAALISVGTNEGKRQNYSGLHKYDISAQGDEIVFGTKDGDVRRLRDCDSSIKSVEIVRNDESETLFLLANS